MISWTVALSIRIAYLTLGRYSWRYFDRSIIMAVNICLFMYALACRYNFFCYFQNETLKAELTTRSKTKIIITLLLFLTKRLTFLKVTKIFPKKVSVKTSTEICFFSDLILPRISVVLPKKNKLLKVDIFKHIAGCKI